MVDPKDPNTFRRYRLLNWLRRKLGRQERRYLTDAEWREYMRSIIPPVPPGRMVSPDLARWKSKPKHPQIGDTRYYCPKHGHDMREPCDCFFGDYGKSG